MSLKHIVSAAIVITCACGIAVAAQQEGSVTASTKPAATQKRASQSQNEGERVFQQHCSRCHTAPDGFSSRISGTVVHHMRVRASLSQHEEEQLLRFLNP